MALSIGELSGFLDLDAGPFEAGIGKAMDALSGNKFKVAAGAAGVLAGTALAAGLMGSMEMDGATRKMNASLGLTKDEAARAGKAAGNLYSSGFGDSMEDATNATEAVISSIKGMRTASESDLAGMAKAMGTVATIAEVDVARAAQVAGQMITSGLAKDGTEAADLLTATLQKVPQAVRGDIIDATDEYGPFFTQLGISGETAMTMLADSSEKGMFGIDKTGDALKEFTIRSTDMSKSSGAAYEALGLSQKEMTNDILAGGDKAETAFAKIIMGLDGMKDPGQQSAAAIALFGTPLEDLGTGEIPKFIEGLANMDGGLGDVSGAAAAAGEEINGGPQAALKEFTRTIQTGLMEAVSAVIPMLTPFIDFFIQFAPLLGPVALGLGALVAVIWVINAAMAAYGVVAGIAAAATWATLWPILAVIAVIALLVAAIWLIVTNWDQISAWLMAAGAAFAAWWTSFWGMIGAFLVQTWQGFVLWIQQVWGGFVNWLKGMGATIAAWWNGFWTLFGLVIRAMWKSYVAAVVTIWGGFVNWLKSAGAAISSWWSSFWTAVGVILKVAWALMIAAIKTAWANITGAIKSAGQAVSSFLSGIWNGIKTVAINVWNAIVGFVKGIPGRFLAGLSALANLYGKFNQWVGAVKGAVVNKFMDVIGWVKGVPGRIVGALGSLGNLLSGAGRQILDGFLSGLKAGFEKVKNFVGGIGSWIADHKGPKAYDLALLVPAGGWIMDGLGSGIEKSMPGLANTLGDVSWMIANGIDPQVTGGGDYAFSGAGASTDARATAAAGTKVEYNFTVPDKATAKEFLDEAQFRTRTLSRGGARR